MQSGEDQLKAWMIGGLEGEAASHAALLRALVPVLRGYFRRRLSDADEIEDLVQETLIAIHTRRMTYDRTRRFTPWLFAVARYKMIDRLRGKRQDIPLDGIDDLPAAQDFADEADARMDVDSLLAGLSVKQAAVIRRTRIDGHSVADTAQATGLSEADVKISVHRGLKALAARVLGERR